MVSGLIAEIVRKSNLNLAELAVISLGLAGVDRDGDRELVLAALERLNLDCQYV